MSSSNYLGTASAGRAVALLAGFVATSLVAGFVAAGLFMPAADAAGSFAKGSADYFDSMPEDLRKQPLSEASVLYAKDGKTVIARFFHENRVLVPLGSVAPVMRNALIAIEDERFYEHGGLDIQAVSRAALKNLISGRTEQGASTITQQYVKNVLLEQAYAAGDEGAMKQATEQSYARKLREMKFAISVEKNMSKDEILEGYLNVALFGNNVYGVESAARFYFSTHANKLTVTQAATLAGLVQLPTHYNPLKHPDRALQRRNVVLAQMRKLNAISEKDFQTAVKQKLGLKHSSSKNGCANAKPAYNAYFCEYVRRSLLNDAKYAFLGKTAAARNKTLERGGLRITTTLDPRIQRIASREVRKTIPIKDPSRLAAAAVTVEPGTGQVLAMAQNRIFNPAGKRGQTTFNYMVDTAHSGPPSGFQPGSTFKPFTLATWLTAGKSLKATVHAPSALNPTPSQYAKSCQRPTSLSWNPHNAGDSGGANGSMSVLNATMNSVNTAYISMSQQLDLCDIADMATAFGLRRMTPIAIGGGKTSIKIQPYPSMVLGAQEVSPLSMAAAYAGFANEGSFCTPVFATRIMDHAKELPVQKTKCTQVISKEVAAGMSYALSQVISHGTAARAVGSIGRPSAGKTGTTDNSVDTWFVGYTPQLATAVWVADPDLRSGQRRSLRNITVNGQYYGTLYGGTLAAPTWKRIMVAASAGMPVRSFTQPPGKMLEEQGIKIPRLNGQPVEMAKQFLERMGFKVEIAPGQVPSREFPGTVAYTTPKEGERADPETATITIHISAGGGEGGGEPGDPGPPGNGGGRNNG